MKNIILFLLFLMPCVSASNSTYFITDLNTRVGIANLTITEYYSNHSFNEFYMTDHLGIAQTPRYNGYAILTKTGYFTNNVTILSTNNVMYIPMTPISQDGIVHIKVTDLISGDRDYCLFFKSNNRIQQCYKHNDTAEVIVNQEYILRPELRKTDGLTSMKNLDTMGGFWTGSLMPFMFIFGIALLLISYIFQAVRKK